MEKLKSAENIATQRLRKTFKYPSESDDEDAVEAGMDEQGNTTQQPSSTPKQIKKANKSTPNQTAQHSSPHSPPTTLPPHTSTRNSS
jgi:hypothetical protein